MADTANSLRCAFGFHNWTKWEDAKATFDRNALSAFVVQVRRCSRCNKLQRRDI